MKIYTYKCLACGVVFEVGEGLEPVCPVYFCRQKGPDALVLINVREEEFPFSEMKNTKEKR